MSASNNVAAPPKFVMPSTKAAHKRMIFESIKGVLSASLSFTIAWRHDPLESDFIDWIEDVLKTLPLDEGSVPDSVVTMYQKIIKRSLEYPLRVVENVDASAPTPAPLYIECPDGTTAAVEQVKSAPLKMSSRSHFEFKGNTTQFLPVQHPFTLTFTPSTPILPSGSSISGLSYDVFSDGEIRERDIPLVFEGGQYQASLDIERSEKHSAKPVTLRPVGASPTVERLARSNAKPAPASDEVMAGSSKASARRMSLKDASGVNQKATRQKGHKTIHQDKISPSASTPANRASAFSRNSVPFPSTKKINTIPPKACKGVKPHHPSDPYFGGNPDSVFAPGEPSDNPFNHFPAHPQANDGSSNPNGRTGIQRAHAFVHKSHPELFWHDDFGERPKEGERRTIEDCYPAVAQKVRRPKRTFKESVKSSSDGRSAIASSSNSTRRSARVASVSAKTTGKKRARGKEDADEDEESRPTQRMRQDTKEKGKEVSRRLSQRFSGLKNAVLNFAGGTFTK